MSQNNLLPFLHTIPMFAEMDDTELMQLGRDLKRKRVDAGENIFFQGDPGEAVYIVESGTVRIYVHAEDGQEVSVRIYGPGDLFGEMSLLDQRPRSATAVAVEKATLWVMSDQDFYRHLRTSHQLALNVMLTLSTRLRETNESIKSLASLDVTRRIAKRLLSLALRQGERITSDRIRITSPLTQGDLASLISASRESTNRALRALQRKGLIDMQEGYLILLKPDELSGLLCTDETWW
ncbi:MAG: Crp/Fnr family transcriptional regulator [Anaerolineae bacterium]|nr:Crp/Fnr family transcriptional regulator [Anaerolineae bacterium]